MCVNDDEEHLSHERTGKVQMNSAPGFPTDVVELVQVMAGIADTLGKSSPFVRYLHRCQATKGKNEQELSSC